MAFLVLAAGMASASLLVAMFLWYVETTFLRWWDRLYKPERFVHVQQRVRIITSVIFVLIFLFSAWQTFILFKFIYLSITTAGAPPQMDLPMLLRYPALLLFLQLTVYSRRIWKYIWTQM